MLQDSFGVPPPKTLRAQGPLSSLSSPRGLGPCQKPVRKVGTIVPTLRSSTETVISSPGMRVNLRVAL